MTKLGSAALLLGALACGPASPRRTSESQGALITASGTITATADDQRTGHYPNQPRLDPAVVGGPTFGRLFKTKLPLDVEEQVFAQPLVLDGKVLVVTESNNVYSLDGETGAIRAMRALGIPWRASEVGCHDLRPYIGITGAPVIDVVSRTAYFLSKTYRNNTHSSEHANSVWYAHAIDVDTLAERTGFPLEIKGNASNDPGRAFEAFYEHQRPALLLQDGVVYAAFGGHCDAGDFRGWVVGFTTDGQIRTLWTAETDPKGGAGIWQSGGGLVSDGKGRIFLVTGNTAHDSTEDPEATPTPHLGQSVVRLAVQGDGSLRAEDFFAPYNRSTLDLADTDFGSGGPVALPDMYFGTPSHPRLLAAAGKAGVLYLLDRDRLGGFRQGSGGGDAVVSQVNLAAGVWSRPAVWPGDGGYVYIVSSVQPLQAFHYGVSADGRPLLNETGRSEEIFGYSSGSPIVTSDGLRSGSALVWATYASSTYGQGMLRAYDAVPDASGKLRRRFEDVYEVQAKFAPPGVGDGRIYVGTADGFVLGYGAPIDNPIAGSPVEFGAVTVGMSSTRTAVITANRSVTITSIAVAPGVFSAGAPTPSLPAALAAGGTVSVPITFAPTAPELYAAGLNVTTSSGVTSLSLRGRGETPTALLVAPMKTISFGGLARGRIRVVNAVLSNAGAAPLTFTGFTPPEAPFTVSDLPAVGAMLAPGAQVSISTRFAPTTEGNFSGSLTARSTGGEVTIFLAGTAGAPPVFTITPLALDFGAVMVGSTASRDFVIRNDGGSNLTITKSKPPASGIFAATAMIEEGSMLAPAAQRTVTVTFTPRAAGAVNDEWILTGDDDAGQRAVTFTGTGVAPPPDPAPEPPAPEPARDAGPPDAGVDAEAEVAPESVDAAMDAAEEAGVDLPPADLALDPPATETWPLPDGPRDARPGDSVTPLRSDDGCGCRLGGARAAPGPAWAVVITFAALVARRRRRPG